MISTKGRYALRVMVDLAEHQKGDEYVPMKEVAERQELSLKYVERIVSALSKNDLIEGIHGKGGGYRLTREPKDYNLWEILRLTEGELAPVACLAAKAAPCSRSCECRTLPVWKKYYDVTEKFFSGITIADVMNGKF